MSSNYSFKMPSSLAGEHHAIRPQITPRRHGCQVLRTRNCHRIFAQYIKKCQNCIIWHIMAFLLINKLWKNAHLATMTFRVAEKPPFSACLKRPLAYTCWEIPYNACPAGNYNFPIYFGPSSIVIGWDNGSVLIVQQWGRDRKTLWWKAAFPQKNTVGGRGGGYPLHAIYVRRASNDHAGKGPWSLPPSNDCSCAFSQIEGA